MKMTEEFLYDKTLLKALDFRAIKHIFNPLISATDPGDNLVVRPLSTADYDKGKQFSYTLNKIEYCSFNVIFNMPVAN